MMDQHFMKDEDIMEFIVSHADLDKNDIVLEIGAGDGRLTKLIARYAGKVVAVEMDKNSVPELRNSISGFENVEIVENNILDVIDNIKFNKIVANIPYSVAEALVYKIAIKKPDVCIMTLPEKFVKRVLNGRGNASAFINSCFSFEVLKRVNRLLFSPPPKTDSYITRLRPHDISTYSMKPWLYITKEVFLQRDKKLKNALREAFIRLCSNIFISEMTKKEAKGILHEIGIKKMLMNKKVSEINSENMRKVIDAVILWFKHSQKLPCFQRPSQHH